MPRREVPTHIEINHLLKTGHVAEAERCARLLIGQLPFSGLAWKALGAALQAQGKDALPALQRTVDLRPHDTEAYGNLWMVLHQRSQFDEAMVSYRQALAFNPGFAEAHSNLGNALKERGHLDAAVTSYRLALLINPMLFIAHSNLGNLLRDLGQLDAARDSCRRALAINPGFAEAHSNLGNVLVDLGQLDDAAASYRRALAINPGKPEVHGSLLFCLSHSDTVDLKGLFEEHCRFGQLFEAPLKCQWPQHTNVRDPDRSLKVGFVSGDFRDHAVAHFIEPVLAQLASHPQFSLHAYYTNRLEDQITQRIQGCFWQWHPVADLSDAELAQKINDDGIDILIDLSGHTAHNRLLTFARKPAPLQLSWIGYPNTTGLQALDYVLCDRFNAPYGLHEPYYVEKFARIPSSGTFIPQACAPAVNVLPALEKKYITFASFNRPSKLAPPVLSAWARVLHAVPNSVMLLGNISDASLMQGLTAQFGALGIGPERLIFRPKLPLYDYLSLHHDVDIILDTWPYTGGTTSNFALWMGVPIVTLRGPLRSHCQSAAVLERAGIQGWVAHDVEEFIQIATHWANSTSALANLRAGMRDRMGNAPLRQPDTVARGLALALRLMWQRWCAGLPTEHFEVDPSALFAPHGAL